MSGWECVDGGSFQGPGNLRASAKTFFANKTAHARKERTNSLHIFLCSTLLSPGFNLLLGDRRQGRQASFIFFFFSSRNCLCFYFCSFFCFAFGTSWSPEEMKNIPTSSREAQIFDAGVGIRPSQVRAGRSNVLFEVYTCCSICSGLIAPF